MPAENLPDPNLGAVLRAMQRALSQLPPQRFAFANLMTLTLAEMAREGLVPREPKEDYTGAWHRLRDTHPLAFLLVEGYYQLLTLGYIVPLPSPPSPPNMNWYRATEKGRQWSRDLRPVPEDPDGFLAAFDAEIPSSDTVIKQYVAEALVTYNRRAWFATAVMIGAASEKAVYLLVEALVSVVESASERRAIEKAIKERNLPKMLEDINKVLTRQRESGNLPYSVRKGVEHHLLSLFDAIRVQRNEAVHPTIGQVTPESVRLSLSAFPAACRKAYDVIEWSRSQTSGRTSRP